MHRQENWTEKELQNLPAHQKRRTAGTGVVEGTFTEPMPLPDGTVIEPTGNSFKYTMVTIAKWQNGQITEEYLFWDNAEILYNYFLNN